MNFWRDKGQDSDNPVSSSSSHGLLWPFTTPYLSSTGNDVHYSSALMYIIGTDHIAESVQSEKNSKNVVD